MSDTAAAPPWPTALHYDPHTKILHVAFEDGMTFDLPAEYLRVESPSAEVQGHHPSERQIIPGRRHVGILRIEEVGNYAVRLVFDDLHDTGLYSWRYLHELGCAQAEKWNAYIQALAARGLSRDPQ